MTRRAGAQAETLVVAVAAVAIAFLRHGQAEVQGVVTAVDRRGGQATTKTGAVGGVAVIVIQVVGRNAPAEHALVAEQADAHLVAGGDAGGRGPLLDGDLVGAGQLVHAERLLELAQVQGARSAQFAGDVNVLHGHRIVGEIGLDLVAPAIGRTLERDADAAKFAAADVVGRIVVEGGKIPLHAPADAEAQFLAGALHRQPAHGDDFIGRLRRCLHAQAQGREHQSTEYFLVHAVAL